MADPVHIAFGYLYFGAMIINPPIVAGRSLPPTPDARGNVVFTFTQPEAPCDNPECSQEIFRLDKNPSSCWIYEMIRLENVNRAPDFAFDSIDTADTFELRSIGNVNGVVFTFRAHVTPRCAPST
jgi:hypothetical protein